MFDFSVKTGYDITDIEFIEREIERFFISKKRENMVCAKNYYDGQHDVLHKKRMMINKYGELEEIRNVPNNKIVNNMYRKMVIQKTNYMFGKQLSIKTKNEKYEKILNDIFDQLFDKKLNNIGKDAINCGISWLYVYYGEDGSLKFRKMDADEIYPGWKDSEHTELDYAIRVYQTVAVLKEEEKIVWKVEVYEKNGITFFEMSNSGKLTPCEPWHKNYIYTSDGEYNWEKIPLIAFKNDEEETPLIKNIKSLQDTLNYAISSYQDHMQEDAHNTILVLVNYDGTNLGEFRNNLSQFGTVKVTTHDGVAGDIKTLQVDTNIDKYDSLIKMLKKEIIENAMGYDAKDDRLGGNANEMNIESMYNDIDIASNGLEMEFQSSFLQLLYFINVHLYNSGYGDFFDEKVEFIFNKDMMMDEAKIIENCQKSVGMISEETIVANHPWVKNVKDELENINNQKQEEINRYDGVLS